MKPLQKYLLLTFVTAIIAAGTLVASSAEMYQAIGYRFMAGLVPLTALFMLAAVVGMKFAVPQLLLRGRYVAYTCFTFMTGYAVIALALGFEYVSRAWLGLPQRISDFSSPWVVVDSLGNCMLLFILLLGLGGWQLYGVWRHQVDKASDIARRLSAYMAEIRQRLDPPEILRGIDGITEAIVRKDGSAGQRIRELSDFLRRQLYEMPMPPVSTAQDDEPSDFSRLSEFLTGKRTRKWRVIAFQAVLVIISAGTFSDTPDSPEFTLKRLGAAFGLYAVLNAIAYINIGWLYRRFLRHHSVRRYLRDVGLLILALTVPLAVIQVVSFNTMVYTSGTPVILSVVTTISSLTTLTLFVAGVTAMLLLKDWVAGRRRVTMLQAETARQEYAFLRKQINPHFLFNVLNNAGIVSEDDPGEALDMMAQLRRLICYQFRETECETTFLGQEIEFLRSYLALEKTRLESLEFSISCGDGIDTVSVPTLLFVPFVENAVKHGCAVDGAREIEIGFARSGDSLEFRCGNSFVPRKQPLSSRRPGGLGIANTLRRLELLYGDRFGYARTAASGRYLVTVTIPLCRVAGF